MNELMNSELQAACRLAEELREMDAAQQGRDDRAILALYYEVRKVGQANAKLRHLLAEVWTDHAFGKLRVTLCEEIEASLKP